MSSAANDKREQLEEEFRRRMHDAEATPSADLWARIDHDLTVQENNIYKGRLVLYRQLAAACFVLFVLAGTLFMYYFSKDKKQQAQIATQLQAPATAPAANEVPEPAAVATLAAPPAEKPQQAAQSAATAVVKPAVIKPEIAALLTQPLVIPAATLAVIPPEAQAAAYALHPLQGETDIESIAAAYGHSFTDSKITLAGEDAAAPKTAFASLQPFYQTAQQAITAVPASAGSRHNILTSAAARQLLHNPAATLPTSDVIKNRDMILAEKSVPRQQQQALAVLLNGKKERSSENNSSDSRWTIGMAYAPSYFDQNTNAPEQTMGMATISAFTPPEESAYNTFTLRDMQEEREEVVTDVDPGFSFAFEAKVGFKLVRRLKLLTGIGYSQNTARTKSGYVLRQLRNALQPNEKAVLAPPTVFLPALSNSLLTESASVVETDDYDVNYRYRHLTVPVGLQYEGRLTKDWYWYAASGIAANFLIQSTILASNKEVKDVNFDSGDSPFRKVQLSGNVSAGVGKRLSNAVSVSIGPEFRGYFNSLLAERSNALSPQGRPYTVGLNMAVNYDLGSGRR